MWYGGDSGPPEHRFRSVIPASHAGRRLAQMRQCTFLCGVDRGCGCYGKTFCPFAWEEPKETADKHPSGNCPA